jgi:hypothetical protein
MAKERYLTAAVGDDLRDKMIFVGGARQVGKTTFATELVAPNFRGNAYFNWDNRQDRKRVVASDWPGDVELLIFDEIHKYRKWKTLLKGEYDKLKGRYRFLVTGSARMDSYRRGGDSLQGRYHYYRLHPFSLAEMLGEQRLPEIGGEIEVSGADRERELAELLRFGGFPEVLFKGNDRALRRWQNEKIERLFREDIRDSDRVRDLGAMKLLGDLLPERAGNLLSIQSLCRDIEVSHRAVSNWLEVLESFYYMYRIRPYNRRVPRSLRKEAKLYLWDWAEVPSEGGRFENLVASHLLKLIHFLRDRDGHKLELYFLRNQEKKEVDFLVAIDSTPWFAVECKLNDESPWPPLRYFRDRLQIPFVYQLVRRPNVDRFKDGIRVVSAGRFLAGLV